jgi:2-phosphosulfolactate phosphatase
MKVDVVLLPKDLREDQLRDRSVVVFDVLRATTTMTAALAAGAREIRVFGTLNEVLAAASSITGAKLLCGEMRCLPPEGFDLGNSPGTYLPDRVRDKTLLMSTTNGTRAIVAARGGARVFTGALVNARAVANTLVATGLDVTLLCAGTDGAVADEDIIGAGAVMEELQAQTGVSFDVSTPAIALDSFRVARAALLERLLETTGAKNVVAAGLEEDVTFAARLNVFDVVGAVDLPTLTVRSSSS